MAQVALMCGKELLTAREAEVLTMRMAGMFYKEIAWSLHVSESLVGKCLASAEAKGWRVPRRPRMG